MQTMIPNQKKIPRSDCSYSTTCVVTPARKLLAPTSPAQRIDSSQRRFLQLRKPRPLTGNRHFINRHPYCEIFCQFIGKH
jgi:hypothetical protein